MHPDLLTGPGPMTKLSGPEGMVSRLQDLVRELHANIEVLSNNLNSVRTVGPDSANAIPQEAPSNALHEVILAIEAANHQLRMLQSEIHL